MAEKQKLLRQSELQIASGTELRLQPVATKTTSLSKVSSSDMSKSMNSTTKDLTSTLMEKNINQIRPSQTFSNFGPIVQPQWRPQQQQPMMWNNTNQSRQPLYQQNQPKPDLSAFDSLLPNSSNSSGKTPMNAMKSGMASQSTLMGFSANQNQQHSSAASASVVKSLTANDITDLLS